MEIRLSDGHPYHAGSAEYAFKAECDMPSVASIIGHKKTMEMFRNPEKFDLYERKKIEALTAILMNCILEETCRTNCAIRTMSDSLEYYLRNVVVLTGTRY